jgi:predicted nucleotidyltransferase
MVKNSPGVAEHLQAVAQKATLTSVDRGVISTSLKTLLMRLGAEFDRYTVTRTGVFGSFARDTKLPPAMDAQADVDVLAVFTERGKKPEFFLQKLKEFAELHYPRTAIVSTPATLRIELLHTRFELVPALEGIRGLQIPMKGVPGTWQASDPEEFAKALQAKDKNHQGLILPLVRLVKYWNALNQHPFDPFALEQRILAQSFTFAPKNLKGFFFDFMRGLHTAGVPSVATLERMRQMRKALDEIDKLQQAGQLHEALMRIESFLPLPLRSF